MMLFTVYSTLVSLAGIALNILFLIVTKMKRVEGFQVSFYHMDFFHLRLYKIVFNAE